MPPLHMELANVVANAQVVADKYHQPFLTPEHLLIGLFNTECKATPFLKAHFAAKKVTDSLSAFLASFSKEAKAKTKAKASADKEQTDENREVNYVYSLRSLRVNHAAEELAQSFQTKVNSLHLLWALLQEHHCTAVKTLVHIHGASTSETNAPDLLGEDCAPICQDWCTEIEALLLRSSSKRPTLMSLTTGKQSGDAKYWRKQLTAASQMLLNNQVIQGTAVERVANTLTRSWASVSGTDRPMASFLFVGPRGSGKRSLARNIASFLYNSPERLNSISMGDFNEELRLSKLVQGDEDTTTDNSQEGALTRLATEYPYSLIYLEDIEHANSKTMDLIHKLLKHGHIQDSQGKIVDFRGNVIILSLSIDPVYFERDKVVGLRSNIADRSNTQESYERLLMEDLERVLRADTLGLVDEVVFFPPLTDDELTERAKVLSKELSENMLRQYGITVTVDDSVYEFLMKRLRELGKDTGTLRRLFSREVSNAVAQAMLANKLRKGHQAVLECPAQSDKTSESTAVIVTINNKK